MPFVGLPEALPHRALYGRMRASAAAVLMSTVSGCQQHPLSWKFGNRQPRPFRLRPCRRLADRRRPLATIALDPILRQSLARVQSHRSLRQKRVLRLHPVLQIHRLRHTRSKAGGDKCGASGEAPGWRRAAHEEQPRRQVPAASACLIPALMSNFAAHCCEACSGAPPKPAARQDLRPTERCHLLPDLPRRRVLRQQSGCRGPTPRRRSVGCALSCSPAPPACAFRASESCSSHR